ncbi:hypothetical protein F0562_034658 [Nyssa sinensis]|uniref:Uncharacterized protein n=1 Tax=Nyssa sinensis TaxID=561372 RepID=A0A5J5A833_9ASTE|nr:hypothetical protein F0562_034658 [Nyssa sinensis]
MPPAQLSVEIDPNSKLHFTEKVAPGKGNKSSLANSDGKGLRYMSNFEDTVIEMEALLDKHTKVPDGVGHVEVDAIEFTSTTDIRVAEADNPDATDYSSSFADTVSGTETCSGLSDAEVESQFFGDNGLEFDGFDSVFPMRKKKLTSHWRSFIRPLMWRCKWTELRIKEFESQASKYARELAASDQRKQLGLNQFTLEGFGSKSLPFTFQNHKKKVMKRRKRKRVEDTTDMTSYMSHHNLFSYRDNKRSDPECTSISDELGNPVFTEQSTAGHDEFGINDDCSFLESKDTDKSLEHILQKIEVVHSRVHKLKAQLDMVMSKNAGKFSSSENLSLLAPCDVQTSSVRSPTFSACNGDTVSMGPIYNPSQHMSEYDVGDLVMPESAVSSYGEAIHVPDIIESTVGLLSSADVTLHQPQSGDSCEDIVDNVLIHNQAAEVERYTFKNRCNQPMEKHQEPETSGQEESTNPSVIPALEPDSVAKTATPSEQSTLKSCLASGIHFPKNKRKRGERKAGSGGWSRKHSGEPDSQ